MKTIFGFPAWLAMETNRAATSSESFRISLFIASHFIFNAKQSRFVFDGCGQQFLAKLGTPATPVPSKMTVIRIVLFRATPLHLEREFFDASRWTTNRQKSRCST